MAIFLFQTTSELVATLHVTIVVILKRLSSWLKMLLLFPPSVFLMGMLSEMPPVKSAMPSRTVPYLRAS